MAEITKPQNLKNTWAELGDKVPPSDAKRALGWVPEIPTCEMFNDITNRQDTAIAHFNQMGIPIWDSTTEYIQNKSFVQTSVGNVYKAKTTHTNQNPETDTSATYWKVWDQVQSLTPTLATGYSQSGTTPLRYKASGGLVNIGGSVIASGTSTSTIFTLPTTHRPSLAKIIIGHVYNGSTLSPALVQVNTNGTVQLINTTVTSGNTYHLNGSYTL